MEIKYVPFHAGGRDFRVERHVEDIDNALVNPMIHCIHVRAVKGQFHILLANGFAFLEGYGDAVPLSPGNDSDEHLPVVEFRAVGRGYGSDGGIFLQQYDGSP